MTATDIAIAKQRFPTIRMACLRLAMELREPYTDAQFTAALKRYRTEDMRVVENRFAAMSQASRDALVRKLMGV